MLLLTVITLCLFAASGQCVDTKPPCWADHPQWTTEEGRLKVQGHTFHLKGISWFGFETETNAPHGLWTGSGQNMSSILDFIKANHFNAIRMPFSVKRLFANPTDTSVDCDANGQDVCKMDYHQLIEHFIDECAKRNLLVMLDQHRLDDAPWGDGSKWLSELWYQDDLGLDEAKILESWDLLLSKVGGKWNVFALDVKNEPHGIATWGYGVKDTDWNSAAERIIRHIGEKQPQYKGLFFIEGVAGNARTSTPNQWVHFWGENLEGVHLHPIDTGDAALNARVVYSPHVYGPDVSDEAYFHDSTFPANMPQIWQVHFGFVPALTGHAIAVSEWGGHYKPGSPDRKWQDTFAWWLKDNCMSDTFYWCLNPNSHDTSGVYLDDWKTPNWDKLALLDEVQPHPSEVSKSADGQFCLSPGANDCTPKATTSKPATTPSTQHHGQSLSVRLQRGEMWLTAGVTHTSAKLIIHNNGNQDICGGVLLRMEPSDVPVAQKWNMDESPEEQGLYQLPDWFHVKPGQTYEHVGLVYTGLTLPTFAAVEYGRKC